MVSDKAKDRPSRERKIIMSRYSAGFLKSLESDFAIVTRETRKPTEEELQKLKAMDDEIHRLRKEINNLQDLMRVRRTEADRYSEHIYGLKTFRIRKARRG